jgi:polygalacturonase
MKRILISLLALAVVLPAGAKTPKKVKEQPLLWPDGTPVPEWFLSAEVPVPESLGKIYNLRDLGVESNPNLVQTAAIQAVIDKAAAEGGGVVVIPEGIYKSGALFFKQGTHLHLKRGAVLLGSESILDFPVTTTRIEGEVCRYFPALINIDHLDGFTLTGNGTIEGNGFPYWRAFGMRARWKQNWTNKDEQRPRLVHVSHSTNVVLADAALQNSPFWTCHIYKSDHVKILNLRLYSPRSSASADGIDLDACTNVLVKGCRITVNDDAVCFKGGKGPWADQDPNNGANENILVEDVYFDHTTGSCVTCGSECIQTRNIIVRNCTVEQGQNLLQLKMRPDTPQHYEFIRLENIKGSCAAVLLVAPWTQFFDLKDRQDIPRSYGEHIVFKDLELECRAFANVRRVDDQYTLNDITFDHVKVQTPRPEWERSAIDNLSVVETYINDTKQ